MTIAVIGGGPAGMMAAVFAAQNGAHVTLFEKNEKLGKKLYITGKGRCNLTNDCPPEEFLSNVATNRKFLFSAAHKWTTENTKTFFEENGLPLKTERGNRVFPASDKASDVTKTLERLLAKYAVEVHLRSEIREVICQNNRVLLNTISDILSFDRAIIATGGLSYPQTGSTGDGYYFAQRNGHSVLSARAALCEIPLCEDVSALQGLSLKNVVLSAYHNGKEVASEFGEMLFTDGGLSGPIALTVSSLINKYPFEKVSLRLDLKPALPEISDGGASLENRLLRDFALFSNKQFKNALTKLFPERLATYVVAQSAIDPEKQVNKVTAEERARLRHLIKNLPFSLAGYGNIDTAVVTSGGVRTEEINPSTMQSKLNKNLYFAGEVLDVDAFTGGFNLQIAFSTGYTAGVAAARDEAK